MRKDGRQVNWGIIGCGWVARDYVAPATLEAANARLVAVTDCSSAALSDIAPDETEITRTTDLGEFLSHAELEAVYVATPNDSHAALVAAAAEAGKHVLCEKPMATNLRDAERMVRACREMNVTYATAFDQRFQAYHRLLKSLIAERRLGAITAVRIHYACWLPPDWSADNWRVDARRAGGGALIDLAPHGLDLSQHLLGEELIEVSCLMQRKVFEYAVDDGAALIGKFEGGALLTMNVAYNCPDNYPRRTLEIIGTDAMAVARDTMGQVSGGTLTLIKNDGMTSAISLSVEEDVSPFRTQIETFSRSLLTGEPFPFSPEGDLRTMALIESAQQQQREMNERPRAVASAS